MNVQRFFAPTSREAMAKARQAFGDSAVILSSRSTDNGFEVVATAEENLESLAGHGSARPGAHLAASREPVREAPRSRSFEERVAATAPVSSALMSSSVEQDTETLAMSTLSFQDYVRERMLRKRREALGMGQPAAVAAPVEAPSLAAAFTPAARPAPQRQPERQPERPAPARASAPAASDSNLSGELTALKAMIEERFNMLSWLGASRQNPVQSSLMLKFIRAGYSPTVARAVLERMPADLGAQQAMRWLQDVLSRNLKVADSSSSLCDEGGVFALVGATGVGKTTTAAKLAAQCVKAYGANSVGLITLDTYRIAGYEQLRAYGRMLGVVAHLAHDRAALQDLLALLANKRMVIIDTAGLGQNDPRIQDMLEVLANPKIKKLLVLNAGSHGETLDDVFSAYKSVELYGAVLSKIDEAPKLGPAVDALIRHQVVLRGVSTGQRVPEDWQRPDATALVRLSLGNGAKSPHDPQNAELGFFFAQPGRANVVLDGGWHA